MTGTRMCADNGSQLARHQISIQALRSDLKFLGIQNTLYIDSSEGKSRTGRCVQPTIGHLLPRR
jgi:hypothetical protein